MEYRDSPSLSVEQCVDRLKQATTRYHVRDLVDLQGRDKVLTAWNRLDPLTKSTLRLAKEFNGTIISRASFDGRESESV